LDGAWFFSHLPSSQNVSGRQSRPELQLNANESDVGLRREHFMARISQKQVVYAQRMEGIRHDEHRRSTSREKSEATAAGSTKLGLTN